SSCDQTRVLEKFACNGTTAGARCSTIANLPDSLEPTQTPAVTRTSTAACTAYDAAWTCPSNPEPCGGFGSPCASGNDCCSGACQSGGTCAQKRCVCDLNTQNTCAMHSTNVTSIILGDYRGGQGDGYSLGDTITPSCSGGCTHNANFKYRATG